MSTIAYRDWVKMPLPKYAIVDVDQTVWHETENLEEAQAEISRLRREEDDDYFSFLLIDRQLGPLSDDGKLQARGWGK